MEAGERYCDDALRVVGAARKHERDRSGSTTGGGPKQGPANGCKPAAACRCGRATPAPLLPLRVHLPVCRTVAH